MQTLFAHVQSDDMDKVVYLCNMIEFFNRSRLPLAHSFDKMIAALPFAANYADILGLVGEYTAPVRFHTFETEMFKKPELAREIITSLMRIQNEYCRCDRDNSYHKHEICRYLSDAYDEIFLHPEIAEELSLRVCMQARNWDGHFVLTPMMKIIEELTKAKNVQYNPKLFAVAALKSDNAVPENVARNMM